MALEDLTPVTRTEAILDGDDISPVTRMEYFLGKAANEVPKPEGVSDAGKVLTVNAAGDGFELDTSLPEYTSADNGKVLTLGEGSESETVIIVPEQSVTIEYEGAVPLNSALTDYFVEGATASLKINNTPHNVTCDKYLAFAYTSESGGLLTTYTVYYLPEPDGDTPAGVYFNCNVDGNYTVSLTKSVPVVEPKWEKIVELPELPAANGNYNLHIASGVASWVAVAP